MSATFVDEKRMTPEQKSAYREYLVGLIDKALASDDFEISTPLGFREIPDSNPIRHEFTGEHGLHVTWRAKA